MEPVIFPEPQKKEEVSTPLLHSYTSDMATSMQATDAKTVQELLELAREKESVTEELVMKQQLGWVFILGAIVSFAAAGGALWFVWSEHNQSRTVPITKQVRPVVFQQLATVSTTNTDIREVLEEGKKATLSLNVPYVIPLVKDATQDPLAPGDFFNFIEGAAPPGLVAQIVAARVGVVATGTETVPFILFSTDNPGGLSAELTKAEPALLRTLYRGLGIDITAGASIFNKPFTAGYISNVPVRTLLNSENNTVAVYGFIAPQTVIITPSVAAFKAVHQTILLQQ